MARKKKANTSERLRKIEGSLVRLEGMLRTKSRGEEKELVVEPWRFLVRRQHPWRKQLYVKGRNLTARVLVGAIKSNQFNDEKAAENFHLPIDAIREALAYVEKNSELLQAEAEIERLMRTREGASRVAQPVS